MLTSYAANPEYRGGAKLSMSNPGTIQRESSANLEYRGGGGTSGYLGADNIAMVTTPMYWESAMATPYLTSTRFGGKAAGSQEQQR